MKARVSVSRYNPMTRRQETSRFTGHVVGQSDTHLCVAHQWPQIPEGEWFQKESKNTSATIIDAEAERLSKVMADIEKAEAELALAKEIEMAASVMLRHVVG